MVWIWSRNLTFFLSGTVKCYEISVECMWGLLLVKCAAEIWLRWGLLIKLLFSEKLMRIIPQAIPGRPRVCYQKRNTILIYCFLFKKLSVGSVFNTCQIIFSRMNLYDLLCIATVIFEYFHGNGITNSDHF